MQELLVKYLLQETSTSEAEQVENWLRDSEVNQNYFNQLKAIWLESKRIAPVTPVDENDAWKRFQQKRTQQQQSPVISMNASRPGWLRYTAAVLLVAGAGWMAYFLLQPRDHTITASKSKTTRYLLPDSSEVVLNKNASLVYSKQFGRSDRTVTLKGEAFFTVNSDSKHPFIVNAEDVSVKVLGTSFNVKNTEARIEVVVESGMVDVRKNDHSVQVKQHEKAIVGKNAIAPEKLSNTSELYSYYRTNQFICNATPLQELVAVLNEAYAVNIKITRKEVAAYTLTTTFREQSLDTILDVISKTFNLTITRENGVILLK